MKHLKLLYKTYLKYFGLQKEWQENQRSFVWLEEEVMFIKRVKWGIG